MLLYVTILVRNVAILKEVEKRELNTVLLKILKNHKRT